MRDFCLSCRSLPCFFMRVLCLTVLTLPTLLTPLTLLEGKEGHTLQPSQIQPIMDKIFAEHVDQKKMSPALMQESIRLYIQQFDPQALYLLRSEIKPYWDPSAASLDALVQQYNRQDYSIFKTLDDLFATSVKRARSIRADLQKPQDLFWKGSTLNPLTEETEQENEQENALETTDSDDLNRQKFLRFAKSSPELERRWKKQWQGYMQRQASRLGEMYVLSKRDQIMRQLEEGLSQRENPYLSKQEDTENNTEITSSASSTSSTSSTPLSKEDRQYYFSLHVLKAIAGSLDPHTAFFDDSEAFNMKTHLDKGFEGLGIFLLETPEGFKINALVKGGPAEKSGLIHPGDFLMSVKVNNAPPQSVEGKSLTQVLDLLRSDHNHPVTLILKTGEKSLKAGAWVEARLTPEKMTLDEDRVRSGYIPFEDGIIGWITLNSFYEGDKGVNSTEDVQNSIDDLRKKGELKGLVLDFRHNGGGYLNQAVKLAGLFIKSGVVVIAKYNDGAERIYRDTNTERDYDGPLLILTSRLTASAAEIVAQALQDYGVALVAGDGRTYGKGTIQAQNVTNDASTSYFKVTVGTYYTVSGKTAQINGVTSDLIVPGPYSLLPIGEAYLEHPRPNDQIAAAFDDHLEDLDLFTREWYLHSYVPYLQPRISSWRQMLPKLRKNNQARILSSPSYQHFLHAIALGTLLSGDQRQGGVGVTSRQDLLSPDEQEAERLHGVPPLVPGDIQLSEALLIVEDMAKIQSKKDADNSL